MSKKFLAVALLIATILITTSFTSAIGDNVKRSNTLIQASPLYKARLNKNYKQHTTVDYLGKHRQPQINLPDIDSFNLAISKIIKKIKITGYKELRDKSHLAKYLMNKIRENPKLYDLYIKVKKNFNQQDNNLHKAALQTWGCFPTSQPTCLTACGTCQLSFDCIIMWIIYILLFIIWPFAIV